MATNNTPMSLSVYSQRSLLKMTDSIFANIGYNMNFRSRLLEQDRIYAREIDWSDPQNRALLANRLGDPSKMQNVQIPVVGPQVDSATAFFAEMFLSSYPVFPVLAAQTPELVDAALAVETILGESAVHFQWPRHLAMCFRDGLKHNLQAIEVEFKEEKVPQIVTDNSQGVSLGKPTEKVFAGNRLQHINLYNLIFDARVPPAEVHKRGDFVGYTDLITRVELKQLFLDLDTMLTMNATEAFQSGTAAVGHGTEGTASYYIPQVNPLALLNPKFTAMNWVTWGNMDTKKKIHYSDMYEKTVLYLRIIPREHGIHGKFGSKNAGDPQIYKLIIINRRVIIFCQRMTNAHNNLGIVIGQMNEDSLGLQTKSYADNAAPYQFLASALYNSGIQSQRRKVYDRIFYDPSRINKSDIDKPDAIARIPVKSEAYGKPISEAFAVAPYQDSNVAATLQIARDVVEMADVATGQNRVQRGQFQKGNKTRYEFETVMQGSDARPKVTGLLMSIGWLQPIKEMLKYNILQYQPPAELFNREKMKLVKVNPADIRALAWEFSMADGAMPADKFIDYEMMNMTFQMAAQDPVARAEWDIMGMMAYQLKSRGAKWVDTFRRTPEQQQQYLQLQQQSTAATTPPQQGPV